MLAPILVRGVPVVSDPVIVTRITGIFLVSVTRYRALKKSAKYRRVVSEYLLPGIGRYWYLLFSIGLTKSKIYLLMNPYILHIVVACGLQQTMVVSSLKSICWTMVTIHGRASRRGPGGQVSMDDRSARNHNQDFLL